MAPCRSGPDESGKAEIVNCPKLLSYMNHLGGSRAGPARVRQDFLETRTWQPAHAACRCPRLSRVDYVSTKCRRKPISVLVSMPTADVGALIRWARSPAVRASYVALLPGLPVQPCQNTPRAGQISPRRGNCRLQFSAALIRLGEIQIESVFGGPKRRPEPTRSIQIVFHQWCIRQLEPSDVRARDDVRLVDAHRSMAGDAL